MTYPGHLPFPERQVAFFYCGDEMKYYVNGELETGDSATLDELIESKKIDRKSLVVEHNLQIIKQQQWKSTTICDGDRIELLSFVGGG